MIGKLKSKGSSNMDDALLDLSDDDLVYTPFPKILSPSETEENIPRKNTTYSCWNNIKTFVICIAIFNIIFVTLEMYLVAIITTIEKRFGFTSSQSGFLLSIKEIVIVLTATGVTHFASNTHRPRFIAMTGLIAALGGFLSMLPYLVYGKYDLEYEIHFNTTDETMDRHEILCNRHDEGNETTKSEKCAADSDETFNTGAYTVFAISSAVIGNTPKFLTCNFLTFRSF